MKDYINIEKHDISDLPNGVTISTMCASGNEEPNYILVIFR